MTTDTFSSTHRQRRGGGRGPRPRAAAGDRRHHRPRPAAHLRVRRPGALPGDAGAGGHARRPPSRSPRWSGPAPSTTCRSWPAGSGTGLSGGALPHADGVLIVTSRMRAIREVRPEDQRAVVEPGVINLDVTKAATPHGYYYAPDPSSQQICSIGGNVAENSGGAHCLKYGFTTNHVLGAEFVTPQGDLVELGGAAPDTPGYDLLGAVVGSEGTLGIVTSVTVRLVRLPEEVRTAAGRLRDAPTRPAPRPRRSSPPASCPPPSR